MSLSLLFVAAGQWIKLYTLNPNKIMSIWFSKTNKDGSRSVVSFSFPFFFTLMIILGLIAGFIAPKLLDKNKDAKIIYLEQISKNHTLNDVFKSIGKPEAEIGSGLFIYKYTIDDGSKILIGSKDNETIMYINQIHENGDVTNIYNN
ncbi:MAG: hypothetical protein GY705_23300 [Bacteroidetes bacterium]|nr:hypothetical protein [Bacteroidota bacterium]